MSQEAAEKMIGDLNVTPCTCGEQHGLVLIMQLGTNRPVLGVECPRCRKSEIMPSKEVVLGLSLDYNATLAVTWWNNRIAAEVSV